EDAVFDFIAGALGDLAGGDPVPLLTDILLYHVSGGAKTAEEIDDLDAVPTLLSGATFGSEDGELIDNEPDVANPTIVIEDIPAENGTIQAIDRVLLPIDVPGNEADELLIGSRKADLIEGGGGNDKIFGLKGPDDLFGGDGNDKIFGGKGHDDLFGGEGDDRLFGGRGKDYLNGGAGDDKLLGGFGHDTFDFTELDGHDVVRDFTHRDTLLFSADTFEDMHALIDAATEKKRGLLVETDDGSVFIRHADLHTLETDNVLLV
ncbi:MAG: fasciclin domain-containing protein, partial [Pseudomonadota bacterium]